MDDVLLFQPLMAASCSFHWAAVVVGCGGTSFLIYIYICSGLVTRLTGREGISSKGVDTGS